MAEGMIPEEGLAGELTRLTNPAAMAGRVTRCVLWVNDLVPAPDVEVADLTLASFGGYSFFTLADSGWTAPDVAAGCAVSTAGTTALRWTVSDPAGQTVFGWAMIDIDGGVLRFVQRFDDLDIRPLEVGDVLTLLPQFTLTSHACSGVGFRAATARLKKRRKKPDGRASVQPLPRRQKGR